MIDDEGKVSPELANAMGTDRLYDVQASDKLRQFYKKLIQTDAQIKMLKQGFESNDIINPVIGYNTNILDRYKRSLKNINPKHDRYLRKKHNKRINVAETMNNNKISKAKRAKRDDVMDQPDGYLIEKKKVLIHYKPLETKRQFPKCSHIKDSKFHEKQLKHPFYQNSQRLDELLDNILDKNIPEIARDPLSLDLLCSQKGKCNHKSPNQSNNLGLHRHLPNGIEKLSIHQATSTLQKPTEESSTLQITDKNWPDDFKEEFNFMKDPTVSTYTINITLFDQAIDNRNNQNPEKTESNRPKNDYITDPSLDFISKIHSNDDVVTPFNSNFDAEVNKMKATENSSPTFERFDQNYDNLIYNKILQQDILSHQMDNHKSVTEEKYVNNNGSPQDGLVEMMMDGRTEKNFDMNLDYSDILLSTPTTNVPYTLNPIFFLNRGRGIEQYTTDWRSQRSLRKLLQIEEEDDDILGYEDLKEVLADEMEAHDEAERRIDNKKRSANLPDVYNPNWKGPIPLYPGEVNAIIKHATIETNQVPVILKDMDVRINRKKNQISDTDYIEDYFDNKYDKLAKIAQAYSDYGVLGSKKEDLNNVNKKTIADEKDVTKNVLHLLESFDNKMNTRSKKGSSKREGIRFEMKHGKDSEIWKKLGKHIKIVKGLEKSKVKGANSDDSSQKIYWKPNEELILPPKRTLKSIAYANMDDIESEDMRALADVNDTLSVNSNKFVESKNASENYETHELFHKEVKNYTNNTNLNATTKVNDFFAMMSDWFSLLAKLSGETKMIKNSSTISVDDVKSNKSLEVSYPSYDSDMIDNIGHRSRVLMSIEEKNSSVTTADRKTKEADTSYNDKQFQSTVQFVDLSPVAVKKIVENITLKTNKDNESEPAKEEHIGNKTISKRSLETESKLNFWNDIYDDEYGVKLDYFERSARDKNSVKRGSLVKKSKNWFEGKVKNIAGRLRSTGNTKKHTLTNNISTQSSAVSKQDITSRIPATFNPKIRKRKIRNVFRDDVDDPNNFEALTANMKKVIREAADAVKETRKITVREENKEETIASSLMQQLVRLMTDVLDFQVQQKTCAKLPADLQKFLEWLTSASDKEAPLDFTSYSKYGSDLASEKKSPEDNMGLAMPEEHLDDRTQYLAIIQSVQELMKQYDDMSDEDKSKMAGVKQYLEDQLTFLNKKVSTMDEYNMNKYKKREIPDYDIDKITKLKKSRIKRKLKFIKNYSKKHTKTTIGTMDLITEDKNEKVENLQTNGHLQDI